MDLPLRHKESPSREFLKESDVITVLIAPWTGPVNQDLLRPSPAVGFVAGAPTSHLDATSLPVGLLHPPPSPPPSDRPASPSPFPRRPSSGPVTRSRSRSLMNSAHRCHGHSAAPATPTPVPATPPVSPPLLLPLPLPLSPPPGSLPLSPLPSSPSPSIAGSSCDPVPRLPSSPLSSSMSPLPPSSDLSPSLVQASAPLPIFPTPSAPLPPFLPLLPSPPPRSLSPCRAKTLKFPGGLAMEFLSKHSAVQSVFILRFLDFTYVQVSNTDVARFGTSLWDSADTTSPSDWPRVDITACPACKTCVTRGFLMYERLTAISHSTDSANRGGLGFRLVPRVLCPGCHSTIMLCLTEASSPPVEGPPPPSLYDVWRSDDVRAFVSAYGHYWLNTFSILSSKRIRLSEDMTSMFLSFGICSRCRKPSKWKCSRCSKSYYCGRRCQKRDWLAHKEICDQKESPLALF